MDKKMSKIFDNNLDYYKSLLAYKNNKQYYDEIKQLYIDRKIVNITTAEKMLSKLISKNKQSVETTISKINSLKVNLPNYVESPTTKQTKKERLEKYQSKYENQGYIIEKDLLYKDNKIFKVADNKLIDITDKRIKIKVRNALNGSFKEIIIRNEPFNKNESLNAIRKLNDNAQIKHKYNQNLASIEVINYLLYTNNINQIIYKELMKQFINNQNNKIKLLCSFNIKYEMFDGDDEIIKRYYTSNFSESLLSPNQIKEFVDYEIDSFWKSLVDYNGKSNVYFYKVDKITVQIALRNKTRAGTYIPLPEHIKNKKAIVNIKNNDDKCILYCLAAYFNYDKIKSHHKSEASTYNKYIDQIQQPENIIYPIDIQHDIPKFEKSNNIKINVYTYDKNFKNLSILYNTRDRNVSTCNLLYIEDENKNQHLCYIKNLSRLLSTDDNSKIHWCNQCLNGFTSDEKLQEHLKICFNHEAVQCIMPKENSTISFSQDQNKFMHPFSCFIDFESTLQKYDDEDNKNSYQKHIPNSIGIKFNCIHNQFSKPIKILINSDPEKLLEDMMIYLENLSKESYDLIQSNKLNKKLTNEQLQAHKNKQWCDECKVEFSNEKNKKCCHHDHISGEYISTLCNKCNLKYKYKNFLPIYIHNLKNYDGHFIINALSKYGYKNDNIDLISAIPNNEERYISFSKKIRVDTLKPVSLTEKQQCANNTILGQKLMNMKKFSSESKDVMFEIRFLDSFAFMSESLSNLADNLKNSCNNDINELRKIFKNTSEEFQNDTDFKYMISKGIYPYEFIDSYDKLNYNKLPKKKHFYSKLNDSDISDGDYTTAQKVWNHFNCKTMMDYHNIYLKSDVLLLSDIWENFRNTCYKIYGLDSSYYYTAPGLSWSAFLKHKHDETDGNFNIELLSDIDMFQFFEQGIRGGLSQITKRYAKANNKYMSNYKKDLMDEYILYLDANNLYGYSMCQYLPQRNFKWSTNKKFKLNQDLNYKKFDKVKKFIQSIPDEHTTGYTIDCDLTFDQLDEDNKINVEKTKQLQDYMNNYPLAPENIQIKKDMLNEWQQEDYMESKVTKLTTNFMDKSNYVINYRILKLYLELGIRIKKINRVLKYDQSDYMRSYIEKNTNERKNAKNDFEKNFYKLMNNSVYGKTMENVRNRITFKLVSSEEQALRMKNLYKRFTTFNENLVGVHLCKQKITLNKPIFIGQTVLDQSKYLMYDFHYNFMLKNIKRKNIDLLFTDTDSLCYHIKNQDPFEIIKNNKSYFDLSDYPKDNELYDSTNKKVIGKFKNESIKQITEFVGLRSKLYCYTVDGDDDDHKRCKGVKKCVIDKKLTMDLYKNCLFNHQIHKENQNGFVSKNHEVYTQTINKIALSYCDDKVYIENNNINTYNIAHYKTIKN